MSNNEQGRALDWDDTIQNDGDFENFEPLPEGEYPFVVKGFERARHGGSEKLPPCPKAVVSLEVDGGTHGKRTIKHNLFLHTKTEGLLCSFFKGIGQRQHGEKLSMNWGRVNGSAGRCKLKIVPGYKDKDKKYNEVSYFIDPDSAQKSSGTGEKTPEWKPGEF